VTEGAPIRINRIISPVTTLGPGVRVGLWVQGCTIGCAGCASTDTWTSDGGTWLSVDAVTEQVKSAALAAGATGISITGGEPFQQADVVAELIGSVRARWHNPEPMDTVVFTGYAAGAARRISPALWQAADLIVAGPYRRDRPCAHPLLSSGNQTLEVLSPLGSQRLEAMRSGRRMQVAVQDGAVSLVGLPDPGDLARLRAELERQGVRFRAVSWHEPP
jgi:anaerobic ribonucleoside-triphosphate reductase activating protein